MRTNENVNVRAPKVTYLRDQRGMPVACVAYGFRVYDNGEFKDMLQFGISCHNPKDRFDRKLAREIAVGRFLKSPMFLSLDASAGTNPSLNRAFHELMLKLAGNWWTSGTIPMRVQGAAKNYIRYMWEKLPQE